MSGITSGSEEVVKPARAHSDARLWLVASGVAGLAIALTFLLPTASSVRSHWSWSPSSFLAALVLAAGTAVHLASRFVRWHFLLRTAGTYIPIQESVRLFLASHALALTPLYAGDMALKIALLRRGGAGGGVAIAVTGAARLHDIAALSFLVALAAIWGSPRNAWPLALIGLAVVRPMRDRSVRGLARLFDAAERLIDGSRDRSAGATLRRLARGEAAAPAALLSLIAWTPIVLSFSVATDAMAKAVPPVDSIGLVAGEILRGGLTLWTQGPKIAGAAALQQLGLLGVEPAVAEGALGLVRLLTLGLATTIGVAVLSRLVWAGRRGAGEPCSSSVGIYDAEIPRHTREHLIRKKVDPIVASLRDPAAPGLDVGCGRGYYVDELRKRGYRLFGVDSSLPQLSASGDPRAAAADALCLPFADGTFDFVCSINVLHHLVAPEAQDQALREMHRVLKRDGMLFLHEINVTNPLFRFYMGYVFPLVRGIDIGNERWIRPDALAALPGWRLREIRYFTFLPDFLPRLGLRLWRKAEQRMERGRYARYGAHFLAVLVREPDDLSGDGEGADRLE